MREQDLKKLDECLEEWKNEMTKVEQGIVCSGGTEELRLLDKHFPKSWFSSLSVDQWNLDESCPEISDLVLACNVFMCASDPKKWIENICRRTKYLVILDHVVAYRGGSEGETSPSTGDVMRYTMPPHLEAKLPTAFDLHRVGERLMSVCGYEYPSGCGVPGYETTKMFIALFRGDQE